MPQFYARLPLTALAAGLAAGAALAAAEARAEGPASGVTMDSAGALFIAYVLEGLDGPEFATAPGALELPASAVPPVRLAMAGPLVPAIFATPFAPPFVPPSLPAMIPQIALPELADVAIAMPLTPPAQAAALAAPALPQGPMPDGSSLAALVAETGAALESGVAAGDALSELPPLDPAQPPVMALSKLDGPGPLPAPRSLAAMIDGPEASAGAPAAAPAAPETVPGAAELDEPEPGPSGSAPGASPAADAKPLETESLTDAIIASLKGNPEIQISLAQQDDARYGVDEARANYLPRIDVTGAWGREFARTIPQAPSQRFRSEATIALNQNLWDFGVTINDIKRARATYRSAQWGTRERIEAISYDIANAYLGVLLQQNLVMLAEDEIASVRKILRIVTVQKDLGLTTPADVERAQTRLDNVRSVLLDRQSALEQARNAYKRLTNHMPLRAAEVPAAGTALPESADVAVDLIDTRSPRLAQAVEDRRSLDKQYDSQADTALPRFGLTIASDYRQDVLGATGRAVDARAMLTFSYRLYNGGGATATKRRIGARLRQADYELDRRRREVEQDIRIDYASLGAAREKIATIEAEITSAERVADLYKQQFRGGRRTVFDLLDAEQLLFAARAKETANRIALRAAEYRVLQKLGGLFDLVSGGQPLPALAQPAPGSED